VHCMLRAPQSRMDVLTDAEIDSITARSKIAPHYNEVIDSESAYELLTQKLNDAAEKAAQEQEEKPAKRAAEEKGFFDNPIVKSVARTAGNTIVRSLLGAIGLGGRRKKGFF